MPLAPEYQALFETMAETPAPRLIDLSPAEGREMYRMARPVNPELTVGDVVDRRIPGPAGDIPIRIYTPEGTGPFPVLVNFHGGGWVIGDLDTADAVCRDFCRTADVLVVSVDYRLAPEHRFPAAVEDSYAATVWVAEHMQELGGNGRLAVGGESAGGNLAAVVSQLARDDGGPDICFQLLVYPVTDADFTRPSYDGLSNGIVLDRPIMEWFWDHYCPDAGQRSNPRAAPLRAADLRGLPPALVVTAEFDALHDEGQAYARALQEAGVTADHVDCDGLVHDFFATAAIFQASRPPFEQACNALRAALEA